MLPVMITCPFYREGSGSPDVVKDLSKITVLVGASLVAHMVKNLPAMQETQVQFLGREDPLKKGMATHSSILPWRIPWTKEPGGLHSMQSQSQTQLSR